MQLTVIISISIALFQPVKRKLDVGDDHETDAKRLWSEKDIALLKSKGAVFIRGREKMTKSNMEKFLGTYLNEKYTLPQLRTRINYEKSKRNN